jgi:TRAP-type mannitol/chloroaromatic compound transport system permease small subunit
MSYDRIAAKLIDSKNIHIPIVSSLNKFVQRVVETAAWLNVVVAVLILITVTLRYGFHRNQLLLDWPLVPMEELQWHFYSVPFMFGLAYIITNDTNIRIDLLRMHMSKKLKQIFEILGILLLIMPCVIILFDFSLDYTIYAITHHESSQSTMGLPHRWIVKSVIPLTMILIFMASLARLIQEIILLSYNDKIVSDERGGMFQPQFIENKEGQ